MFNACVIEIDITLSMEMSYAQTSVGDMEILMSRALSKIFYGSTHHSMVALLYLLGLFPSL
jgi:hypothetical protein